MPPQIDPLKLIRYKQARLKKKSISESLLIAGQSATTARAKASQNIGLAKVGERQLAVEIKSKITVDYVLAEIERVKKLAESVEDYSTAQRSNELLGKFLAMFTERVEVSAAELPDNQFSLDRLRRLRQQSVDKSSNNVVIDVQKVDNPVDSQTVNCV